MSESLQNITITEDELEKIAAIHPAFPVFHNEFNKIN